MTTPINTASPNFNAVAGCLLGGAVGDAIGLPYEGLSARRAKRLAKLPLRHRFVLGRGMFSDDTDHSLFVAQALLRSHGDVELFRRVLAWRLRWWLLCLPAGIGLATLKGILRMWCGLRVSGVFSAGNGPSMRSAVIGARFARDEAARRTHVTASTRLTHTDPKALAAAMAVAEIAARLASGVWAARPAPSDLAAVLAAVADDSAWQQVVRSLRDLWTSAATPETAAGRFGGDMGVSGYSLHSVPFAIYLWHHHFGDYRATIEAVTQAGGDVDTIAAIAGALAGMSVGPSGIPSDWRQGILDWPHSPAYLLRLASGLANPSVRVPTGFSPWLFPRGLVFTLLVLAQGWRRLLPPY